jgi:hypothetical protein
MNPPGSVSRVSVREPSNYEKVDSFKQLGLLFLTVKQLGLFLLPRQRRGDTEKPTSLACVAK